MPEVITSTSGNYCALIGSMVRPYYFRADGGAFVDTLFGPDLSKAFQDGSFQTAIVAHKIELAIVYPQRQDYKARRPLTIGEFYINELFQEVWCLPIRSWIRDFKTKKENPGRMKPQILSHFLMRGQSMDEFSAIIRPLEENAFIKWEQNKEAISQQYPSAKEFIKSQVGEGITSFIYTANIAEGQGVKPYYYLEWKAHPPSTPLEQDIVEVAQEIGRNYADLLYDEVVEKAHEKALSGETSSQPALPKSATTSRTV